MNNLLIIGAGGHGKVAADIAFKMNRWHTISFLDDRLVGESVLGYDVIGKTAESSTYYSTHDFFVAIGNNEIRERLHNMLEANHVSFATLIHPSAVIAREVNIGPGTLIAANVVIGPSSQIGKGCIINTSASVDHDNVLDDYIHISPGVHLSGYVSIEKLCWLGTGAVVINSVHIVSGTICGAGSVVIASIDVKGIYIGVPAVLKT